MWSYCVFLKKYSHLSAHLVSKWLNCAEDRSATVESGTAHAPPSTWVGVRYACQGQLTFWSTSYSSLKSYRNSCHVCIGMIWQSSLHTRRHMGGNSADPGIWRQGPHSSPGSPQAPPTNAIRTYPMKVQIKHCCFVCLSTMYFKSIPSIAYSKLSVSISVVFLYSE